MSRELPIRREGAAALVPPPVDARPKILVVDDRKEDYPGTGIGLCTCKKFLELYGGTISFSSIPGKGTIFTFTIPDRSPGEGTTP